MKATGTKYLQMMKTMVECPMNKNRETTSNDKIHNMQLGTGTIPICNIGNQIMRLGALKVVANWR